MPNLSRLPAPKNLIDPRRVAALTDVAKRAPDTTAQRAWQYFPRPPMATQPVPEQKYAPEVYDSVQSLVQDFVDTLSAILPLNAGFLETLKGRLSTTLGEFMPGSDIPPPAPTPTNRNIIDRVPAGILARRKLVPGYATPGARPPWLVRPPGFMPPGAFPDRGIFDDGLNLGGGAFPNPMPSSGYVNTGGGVGMGANPPYN